MPCYTNRTGARVSGHATCSAPVPVQQRRSCRRGGETDDRQFEAGRIPSVRLHGKGNKFRTCPLWPKTATSLSRLVAERDKNDESPEPGQPAFDALWNTPRRDTVCEFGKQGGANAGRQACQSAHDTAHNGRSPAVRAGVDINTIRAWLGHVSLDTTHIYAEVDMEMKAKALAMVDISGLKAPRQQRSLPSLMAFLKAL